MLVLIIMQHKSIAMKLSEKMSVRSLVYIVRPRRYAVSDVGVFFKSSRTIDIKLYDISANDKLINLLGLPSFINDGSGYSGKGMLLAQYFRDICRDKMQCDAILKKPYKRIVRLMVFDARLMVKVKQAIEEFEKQKKQNNKLL